MYKLVQLPNTSLSQLILLIKEVPSFTVNGHGLGCNKKDMLVNKG